MSQFTTYEGNDLAQSIENNTTKPNLNSNSINPNTTSSSGSTLANAKDTAVNSMVSYSSH